MQTIEDLDVERSETPAWKSWGGSALTPTLVVIAALVIQFTVILEWALNGSDGYEDVVHVTIWLESLQLVLLALALFWRSWLSSWLARLIAGTVILVCLISVLIALSQIGNVITV